MKRLSLIIMLSYSSVLFMMMLLPTTTLAFVVMVNHHHRGPSSSSSFPLFSWSSSDLDASTFSDTGSSSTAIVFLKEQLVRACTRSTKPLLDEIQSLVRELEETAEQVGIGQASSLSGLLSGECELLYSPEDITRSSPFFWAFRKAFPDQSDQIFGITDAIPAPIKQVGPAYQTLDITGDGRGTFVSQVKVATLNGMATSIMTTKGKILGIQGIDGLELQIETTKPEESTILKTLLGPLLFPTINDILPPFPSGQTLERIQPGSSKVIMRTTFCDESLRISRNDDQYDGIFVWKRKEFSNFEEL